MGTTEADRGATRVDVVPVVVVVSDGDRAVLASIAIAVADEGTLPVIVETAVGDGDAGAAVRDVDKAVVVVLVVAHVARDVDVVDPDAVGGLDTDGVSSAREDLGDFDVANNDVGLLVHAEAHTVKSYNTTG